MQKVDCMSKKSVTDEDFFNLYKYNFLIPQKSLQRGLKHEHLKCFALSHDNGDMPSRVTLGIDLERFL